MCTTDGPITWKPNVNIITSPLVKSCNINYKDTAHSAKPKYDNKPISTISRI